MQVSIANNPISRNVYVTAHWSVKVCTYTDSIVSRGHSADVVQMKPCKCPMNKVHPVTFYLPKRKTNVLSTLDQMHVSAGKSSVPRCRTNSSSMRHRDTILRSTADQILYAPSTGCAHAGAQWLFHSETNQLYDHSDPFVVNALVKSYIHQEFHQKQHVTMIKVNTNKNMSNAELCVCSRRCMRLTAPSCRMENHVFLSEVCAVALRAHFRLRTFIYQVPVKCH